LRLHGAAYDGQRHLIAESTSATRVGARRDLPGGAGPPKPLFDERLADPNEGREGTWRAEPLRIGAAKLLSKVKKVGLQTHKQKG
jgi:hypothetical protein